MLFQSSDGSCQRGRPAALRRARRHTDFSFPRQYFYRNQRHRKRSKNNSRFARARDLLGKDEDPAKVSRYKQARLGATTKEPIRKGQLIFETDMTNFVQPAQDPVSIDSPIRDSQDGQLLSFVILPLLIIGALGAACTILGGQIWIIVLAFRKSLLWAISCLLLPPAATIYEIRNWEQTQKVFNLQVIGFALLGLVLGTLIGAKVKTDILEGELAKIITVIWATKDLPENSVITEADLTEYELAESKVPADAITDKTLVVGHKALYGIAKNSMITPRDISK